jgi:hypothetical protein
MDLIDFRCYRNILAWISQMDFGSEWIIRFLDFRAQNAIKRAIKPNTKS